MSERLQTLRSIKKVFMMRELRGGTGGAALRAAEELWQERHADEAAELAELEKHEAIRSPRHTESQSELVAETDEERQLLINHRQKLAAKKLKHQRKRAILQLAMDYVDYLENVGETPAFGTFQNGFLEGNKISGALHDMRPAGVHTAIVEALNVVDFHL